MYANVWMKRRLRRLFRKSADCIRKRIIIVTLISPGSTTSCNDAGEPSGTAGVPMLESLKLSGLQDCCAVTVRYFGGIKLGAGGLVRAYSRSVSETLKLAPKVETILMDRYTLTFSYDLIGKLDYLLKDQADVVTKTYGEQVVYEFLTTIESLPEKIQELTSGRYLCRWLARELVEKDCS